MCENFSVFTLTCTWWTLGNSQRRSSLLFFHWKVPQPNVPGGHCTVKRHFLQLWKRLWWHWLQVLSSKVPALRMKCCGWSSNLLGIHIFCLKLNEILYPQPKIVKPWVEHFTLFYMLDWTKNNKTVDICKEALLICWHKEKHWSEMENWKKKCDNIFFEFLAVQSLLRPLV